MDDPNIWMLIAKALRNRRPPGGGLHVASGSGPYFDPGGGAPMPPPWVHPMPPESYPGIVTTPATPEEPIPQAATQMPQGAQDHASSRAHQVVNDLTKTWMIRPGSQGRVHGPSFDRPKPKVVSGTPGPKPTRSTSTFQGIKTAGGFTSASKKMPK